MSDIETNPRPSYSDDLSAGEIMDRLEERVEEVEIRHIAGAVTTVTTIRFREGPKE